MPPTSEPPTDPFQNCELSVHNQVPSVTSSVPPRNAIVAEPSNVPIAAFAEPSRTIARCSLMATHALAAEPYGSGAVTSVKHEVPLCI